MNSGTQKIEPPLPGRITSVDFFRGFTMFIVGVAIPFAVANRLKKGATDLNKILHGPQSRRILLIGPP